ncbi:MAG: trypsin-like peptidase domain-containing protein [Clostridia bacterium]|nr:trypsin-like peptidase domain-containing protein [Clostridia bacterium]
MKSKRKVYILVAIVLFGILLFAFIRWNNINKKTIHIKAGDIDFSDTVVAQEIKEELDDEYTIGSTVGDKGKESEAKAINFANQVTYLLLGAPGEEQSDFAAYKKREEEFNKITDLDGSGIKYQRSGIRYKIDRGPEATRKIIRNRVLKYKDYGKATVLNVTGDVVEVKVYMEDVTAIVTNDDNPQEVNYVTTKMELRYYLTSIYGTYRLKDIKYRLGDDIQGELDKAEEDELNGGKENNASVSAIDEKYFNEYDFSKLENFTEDKRQAVYKQNIDNVVRLNAYDGLNITNSATGVLISDGYVVTSWNFFEKALSNAQYINIFDKDGNDLEFEGVISVDTNIDIVIIKLKEKRTSTTKMGNTQDMRKEDPILSIGTKSGFKLSTSVGIIAENVDNQLKNIMTITESEAGGPVYNEAGELIAINTDQSVNSSISVANSIEKLKDVKDKLDKDDFSKVKSMSFEALKEKYYYSPKNEEIVVNQIKKKKWDEYKKIGDIENTIPLKLNKASYYNGIIGLRYENDIEEYMSGIARSYRFIEELKNSGYETVYESKTKCVFRNGTYKVTMMEEMGYLIVIMTKI